MNALRLLITFLIAAMLVTPMSARAADGMIVTFIDVGKGDSILIQSDDSALLIDAGYATTVDVVRAALDERGVTKLDAMIVTHYDKDHVGGAAEIADAYRPGVIYLPGYEGESSHYLALMDAVGALSLDARRVSEDISFTLGNVDYTIFASPIAYDASAGEEGNDNDVSLVIAAAHGADSWLFAGDIETAGIEAYLSAGHGMYDVLKWPHHGKGEPLAEALIAQVQPKIALITDSEDDPAKKKILKALQSADVETLQSSVHGTITVTGDGAGQYTIETEK